MMNKILSDIYRGKYAVIQKHTRMGTPFAKLLDQSNELEDRIRKDLPGSLKDPFDQYIRASADLPIWPARKISSQAISWALV